MGPADAALAGAFVTAMRNVTTLDISRTKLGPQCAGIIAGLIYLKYPSYYPRIVDPSEQGYARAATMPPPQLDLRH